MCVADHATPPEIANVSQNMKSVAVALVYHLPIIFCSESLALTCIKLPVVETKIAPVKQRHWYVKIMNASNTDLDLTQISVKISLRDHWWIFQIYKVPCEICGFKVTHDPINMLRIFNLNRKVSLKWQNELHTCLTAKFNSNWSDQSSQLQPIHVCHSSFSATCNSVLV